MVLRGERVVGEGVDWEDWDSLAQRYEADLLEIADGASAREEEIAALGAPERRIADFGCGPGSLLPLLTNYWMREELAVLLADHGLHFTKVRWVECGWKEEIEHVPSWVQGARPWDWLVGAEHGKSLPVVG